jgi:nitrogen fixation NifU-like protein
MSDALYQDRIVALAKAKTGAGRLEHPTASARRDNPLCGDRVTMDVRLDDSSRIVEVAHQVRGCLLCQAAASALAGMAPGRDLSGIAGLRHGLNTLIGREAGGGEAAEVFTAFAPLKDHKSRHDCVNLPFDALEAAMTSNA